MLGVSKNRFRIQFKFYAMDSNFDVSNVAVSDVCKRVYNFLELLSISIVLPEDFNVVSPVVLVL